MKNQKAVTFVEVLVSIMLLEVFLCAILGAFLIGALSQTCAKHRLEAVNVLQKKIEELKNTGYGSISNSAGQVSVDVGPDLTKDTGDDLRGTLTVTTADMYGYKKVEVRLLWTETGWGRRDVSLDVTTYINIWSKYCE